MLRCMRTTLTLDDDVAAKLERMRRTRHIGLRELVNNALRRGLQLMNAPEDPKERYTTTGVDLGRCQIGTIDDISDALAVAEGEAYK